MCPVARARAIFARVSHPLFDLEMNDGSRHFGDLPERYDPELPEWRRIRDAVPKLTGAKLTGYVTDDVTEAWIDFRYQGHEFSINNQQGQWWFFVRDPACPDALLVAVLEHFEGVLSPRAALARRVGPLSHGSFRVMVHEADSRVSSKDFTELESARRYADDAASETENGPVHAYVVDSLFRVVASGEHY